MNERPNIFSYSELKAATGDFDDANKLGEGGFGPVYKVFTHLSPSLSIFLFIDLYVHASMHLSLSLSLSLYCLHLDISLLLMCLYLSLYILISPSLPLISLSLYCLYIYLICSLYIFYSTYAYLLSLCSVCLYTSYPLQTPLFLPLSLLFSLKLRGERKTDLSWWKLFRGRKRYIEKLSLEWISKPLNNDREH